MRRLTVLILPLRLVFPASDIIKYFNVEIDNLFYKVTSGRETLLNGQYSTMDTLLLTS